MNTDDLLANAVEFLEENAPDNAALVPISVAQERDLDNGKLQWACYLQVDSKRWGEFETSHRANYPDLAINNALKKLRREFQPN